MQKKIISLLILIIASSSAIKAEIVSDSTFFAGHSAWNPKLKMGPNGVHFAWGAEFGSTIDMSGHQMSSIDFNAAAGISYKWLSFAGIGVGANIVVSNSCRTYPVFVLLRTDFSKWVKLLFLDFRAGVALNYLEDNSHQAGAYISPSVGFNLATGKNFRSYLSLGYTYISRNDYNSGDNIIKCRPLSMATVRLGLSF